MIIEIKAPSPGESINEIEIANWFVEEGDIVDKDQELAEIESDKATITLNAEESGKISDLAPIEQSISVGTVICKIDTSVSSQIKAEQKETQVSDIKGRKEEKKEHAPPESKEEPEIKPGNNKKQERKEEKEGEKEATTAKQSEFKKVKTTPLAQKLMEEYSLSVEDIINGLKKISKKEIEAVINVNKQPSKDEKKDSKPQDVTTSRQEERKRMSPLRRKLAARLVSVKNETAMLTTFNEVDMSKVIEIRKKYKQQFQETHDVKLGFMSFFTKAVAESLKKFPLVGSVIDGENLVIPGYSDIGIAVQAPKGLMVPVLRNVETMHLAQIESEILKLAKKARESKLSIDEMTGGTFTITNGGVFGSLLSTPILNPPQSGILGMHNIVERPVAVHGKVEIRPMMYIALSYDHRIIDGATSVQFLVSVKQYIEDPVSLMFDGKNPEEKLLGLG